MSKHFWQHKTLHEMTHQEWESICDGCAKCCLHQLEDEETHQLVFTNVACDLLNDDTCMCKDYPNRKQRVPSCMTLTPSNIEQCAEFAPPSCAYVLLHQGKPLPDWHHLVTNDKQSIHAADASVKGKVRHERDVDEDEYENYVVEWP